VCGAHTLFRPHPQPLSYAVGEGSRAFPLSREAGEGDKGGEGNTARLPVHACAGKNSPCCRDSVPNRRTLVSSCRFPPLRELIRVHRLSSLCAGRTRFFALTPSPSPTQWARGAARSPSPASRERGTKGVRATRRACLFTLALGKTAPAAEIPCRTVVPLSAPAGSPRFARGTAPVRFLLGAGGTLRRGVINCCLVWTLARQLVSFVP
jgi:hypothetical protein